MGFTASAAKRSAQGYAGGITSDINLNRGDEFLTMDRAHADHEDKLLEQAHQIKSLQTHVFFLERQVQRAIQLNPTAQDELLGEQNNDKEDDDNEQDPAVKEQALQLANLIQNSTLLRSYEQIMQQYETETEKKANLIQSLEKDLQLVQAENTAMSQQIYKLQSKAAMQLAGVTDENATPNQGGDLAFDFNDKIQKDKMVELLKRNHDVMMEKYEIYRQRNEELEKNSLRKEKLYSTIKAENDELADQLYQLKRSSEDIRQENAIFQSKLRSTETQLKQLSEQSNALKTSKQKFESQLKVSTEQLDLVQKSHDELVVKHQAESELMSKEINMLAIKEREAKNKLIHVEKDSSEVKDQVRQISKELEVRTKENDHLVSLLEDQEQKISLYEEKEKSILALANESKKRIEDSNLERDRVLLKEQQYLTKITRLEDQLKSESTERSQRHERVVESLRQKHRTLLDQKEDEISDLARKLSDSVELSERTRMDRDSLREEVNKLQDQWRTFKEDTSAKYEQFNKQLSQQESLSEEKQKLLKQQNEKLKEELETLTTSKQSTSVLLHEQEVKLDSYVRDYQRYFDDNKRLRELINQLRDEKESALSEVNRLKIIFHSRINELNDECNVKVAHLENNLLELKEKHKQYEERAYSAMISQEKITEKWKDEHRSTVTFYDRQLNSLKVENRHLSDKVVELKGQLKASRGETVYDKPRMGTGARSGSNKSKK